MTVCAPQMSIIKLACTNRSNQSYFFIRHKSLSQYRVAPKNMETWHQNWTINAINKQRPLRFSFNDVYPSTWVLTDFHHYCPLCITLPRTVRWFWGDGREFWICLLWIGRSFLLSFGQEVMVAVRHNKWYIITHSEYHQDIFHLLY